MVNLVDRWIRSPKVLAEHLLRQSAVTCSITMPVQQYTAEGTVDSITTTIPFYMSRDFVLGLSADFKSLFDPNDNIFAAFNDTISTNVSAFTGSPQVALQSEPLSAQMWKGSKMDDFSVECTFVCTNRGINPTQIISALSGCVLPQRLQKNDTTTTAQSLNFLKAVGGLGANALWDIGDKLMGAGINLVSKAMKNEKVQAAGDTIKQSANDNPLTDYWDKHITSDATRQYASDVGDLLKSGSEKIDLQQQSKDLRTRFNNTLKSAGMVAPLHYGYVIGEGESGGKALPNTTVCLRIGDWFEANELVVTGIGNITFSKEVIAPPSNWRYNKNGDLHVASVLAAEGEQYGFPLYAQCSIRLRPCTMMYLEKFQSYFKKTSDNFIQVSSGYADEIQQNIFGNLGTESSKEG